MLTCALIVWILHPDNWHPSYLRSTYLTQQECIIDIQKGFNPLDKVEVEIKYVTGDIKKIKTLCRIDTKNELEYYKNGGILQYVLRNMI